ncbi:MAG: hypothetical protein JXB42_01375 [Deltaproteobacteria bacterium]|nr:hypothetical protein [Deltaproteobacteria bacterium]
MRLEDTDDPVIDAVDPAFIYGHLLTVEFIDYQKATIQSGGKNRQGYLSGHGVNMSQVPTEEPQLLTNRFSYFLSTGPFAAGYGQVAFTGPLLIGSRLGGAVCTGGMEHVDDLFRFLSGCVQQGQVGGVGNVRGCAGGINNQLALILCLFFRRFLVIFLTGTRIIRGCIIGGTGSIVGLLQFVSYPGNGNRLVDQIHRLGGKALAKIDQL